MIDAVDAALRALQASLFAREVYFRSHAAVRSKLQEASRTLATLLTDREQLTVSAFEDRIVFDGAALPSSAELIEGLFDRLRQRGVEFVTFVRGVTEEELAAFLDKLEPRAAREELQSGEHLRLGAVGTASEPEAPASIQVQHRLREHGKTLRDAWTAIGDGAKLDSRRLSAVVSDICTTVIMNQSTLIPLASLRRHDEYNFVHSINVGILGAALAESMAWDPEWLEDLATAAVLHDVGKQLVPGDVLRKEGSLTAEERRIVERHPIDGARLLLRTPGVPELAPVVAFEHHIGVDGSGYPRTPGRRPHLASQIIQVADVFDALRTHRPYRSALSLAETTIIMKATTQLDPMLVSVFLERVATQTDREQAPESLDQQMAA